ncbi:MAG TPA: DUF6515 family protein [Verrucomicrobiae bacterium]|nr:DUF6515 family protein [Verrucomicrobiae bacterium]
MRFANVASIRRIGVGWLTLFAAVPLIYAQRPQQPQREAPAPKNEPAPRVAPAPRAAPAPRGAPAQRRPVVVDRVNHGTIRHMDTHVVERPPEAPHGFDQRQHIIVHRDVDVDVGRSRFWHGFAFGARVRSLRVGYVQIFVNGAPYFYDDGIYYQQAGNDYQEVYPPVGADVQELPDGAIEIDAGNLTYYYAGGAFYVQQDGGFVVAPTPLGVTVPELPPGAIQVAVDGGVAYQFNGIYYQPVFVDGVTQYTTFMP